MSDKTKKITRTAATILTIGGVVGLFVSGSTDADVSNIVKIGTMIATVIGTVVTNLTSKS